jgi:hypothetical protein
MMEKAGTVKDVPFVRRHEESWCTTEMNGDRGCIVLDITPEKFSGASIGCMMPSVKVAVAVAEHESGESTNCDEGCTKCGATFVAVLLQVDRAKVKNEAMRSGRFGPSWFGCRMGVSKEGGVVPPGDEHRVLRGTAVRCEVKKGQTGSLFCWTLSDTPYHHPRGVGLVALLMYSVEGSARLTAGLEGGVNRGACLTLRERKRRGLEHGLGGAAELDERDCMYVEGCNSVAYGGDGWPAVMESGEACMWSQCKR